MFNVASLLTLVVLILKFAQTEAIPYTVTPLEDKAGIYYYNLGHAKISNDKFTLLSYLNITFYHIKLNSLKRIHEQSISLCSKMSEAISCKNSLKLSQVSIPHLESKFDTIFHLVGHKFIDSNNVRKRRGLFNGVSHVFNCLLVLLMLMMLSTMRNPLESLIQMNEKFNCS